MKIRYLLLTTFTIMAFPACSTNKDVVYENVVYKFSPELNGYYASDIVNKNVTDYIIPHSIKNVPVRSLDKAFSNNVFIKKISIYANLFAVSNSTFSNCPNLSYIYVDYENTLLFDTICLNTQSLVLCNICSYSDLNNFKYKDNDNVFIWNSTDEFVIDNNGTAVIMNDQKSVCYISQNQNISEIVVPDYIYEYPVCSFSPSLINDSLTSIDIGKNVSYISDKCFECAFSLQNITVDSENTKYKSFDNSILCKTNSNELQLDLICVTPCFKQLPNKKLILKEHCFSLCVNMKKLFLDKNYVVGIEEGALYNCSNLSEYTGPFAISEDNSIKFDTYFGVLFGNVEYGNSYLANNFYIPKSLRNVYLTNDIESIPIFSDCSSINSIYFENNLEHLIINSSRFENCSANLRIWDYSTNGNLTVSILNSDNPLYVTSCRSASKDTSERSKSNSCIFNFSNEIVTHDNGEYYLVNDEYYVLNSISSNVKSFVVPDLINDKPVKEIRGHACEGTESLISLVIGENVNIINDCSFKNCDFLESIIINSSSINLKRSSFYNCSRLRSINFTGKNIIFGEYCFYNCELMDTINLSSQCSIEISAWAFAYCKSLKEFISSNKNNIIAKYSFYKTQLEKIYIAREASISNIDIKCMFGDSYPDSLKSITIGELSNYSKTTFSDCLSLEEITIEEPVKLSNEQFVNCFNLKSINANTFSIGKSCFKNCKKLEDINIKKWTYMSYSISIEEFAFEGCESMAELGINESGFEVCGNGVFKNCTSLSTVSLVGNIYKETFYNCTNLSSLTLSNKNSDTFSSSALYNVNNVSIYLLNFDKVPTTFDTNWNNGNVYQLI